MFREGTKVEARFRGGKYFPGVISRRNHDRTFDVEFDDGDRESNIPEKSIRFQTRSSSSNGGGSDGEASPSRRSRPNRRYNDDMSPSLSEERLFVGQQVEAQFRGKSKFFRGTIMRDNKDGTFKIQYDDGDVENRVHENLIRIPGKNVSPRKGRNLSKKSPRASKGFRMGESVEAKFRGGSKFYPGRISSVNFDGTYDINFNDGDQERNIPESSIRLTNAFEEDDPLESSFGSPRLNSSVERILTRIGKDLGGKDVVEDQFSLFERLDMSAKGHVMRRDFERLVKKMGVSLTRDEISSLSDAFDSKGSGEVSYRNFLNKVIDTFKASSRSSHAHQQRKMFSRGDRVKAPFRGGKRMYPGKILRVNSNGTVDIKYDDGDLEQRIDPAVVESLEKEGAIDSASDLDQTSKIQTGDKVTARFRGGRKMFPGKIRRVNADGTFDIQYDDGDFERRVPANYVKSKESENERPTSSSRNQFQRGTRVEARYRNGRRFMKGKITRDNKDDTYDILYDDGDVERSVPRRNIRVSSVSDDLSEEDSQEFTKGQRVKGKFRGGTKYFPGTVQRVNPDGTYNIQYDDGDFERNISASMLKSDEEAGPEKLREGDRVEARFRNSAKFYPGRITRIHVNGSCDIAFDDGDSERSIKPSNIRSLESSRQNSRRRGNRKPEVDSEAESDFVVQKNRPKVNDRVEARFKGGRRMFPGKIVRANSDGTYDIHYDDGDSERRVRESDIKVLEKRRGRDDSLDSRTSELGNFSRGDRIEGRFRGGKRFFPGKIVRVNANGTYDVQYDDGDSERGVRANMLKAVGGGSRARSNSPKNKLGGPRGMAYSLDSDSEFGEQENYRTGDRVEARFRGGKKYYGGKIVSVNRNGTYGIAYDDGDRETSVDPKMIRSLNRPKSTRNRLDSFDSRLDEVDDIQTGDRVEARFRRGNRYFAGTVKRKHRDGTFDIHYDDGDREQGVEADLVRKLGTSKGKTAEKQIRQGDRVEARFRGGSKFYPGEVIRVRADGSFDIAYDDGDTENRVRASWVRASGNNRKGSVTDTDVEGQSEILRILRKTIKGAVNQQRVDSFYDVFEMFDKNGDGKVSRREFDQALRKLKVRFSPPDMRKLLAEFDKDGDGTISYREFVRTLKDGPSRQSDSELSDVGFQKPRRNSPVRRRSPGRHRSPEKRIIESDSFSESSFGSRNRSRGKRAVEDSPDEAVDDTVTELRKKIRKLERQGRSIKSIFETLDRNDNGYLDRTELTRGLRKLGLDPLSRSQAQELIDRFDTNRDSRLDVREFKRFVQSGSLGSRPQSRSPSRSRPRGRGRSRGSMSSRSDESVASRGRRRRSLEGGKRRKPKRRRSLSSDGRSSSYSEGGSEDSLDEEDELYEDEYAGGRKGKQFRELKPSTRGKLSKRIRGDTRRSLNKEFRRLAKGKSTVSESQFKAVLCGEDRIGLSRSEVSILGRYFAEGGKVDFEHFLRYCRDAGDGEASKRLEQLNKMRELQELEGEDDTMVQEALIKLRSMVRKAVTTGVAADYRQVFEMIDRNGSGKISKEEFDRSLKRLGFELSKDEVKKLVKRFAAKEDSTGASSGELSINYKDFVKVCSGGMDQERWIFGSDGKVSGNTYEGEVEAQVRQKLRKWGTKSKKGKSMVLEAFKKLDRKSSGYVSRRDFRRVASDLDWKLSQEEVGTILNRFDTKANGKFAYKSFTSFVSLGDDAVYGQQENLRELISSLTSKGVGQLECFQMFDSDHDGKISATELAASMSRLGFGISLREAKEIIRKVDINRDGMISYAEFVRAFGDVSITPTTPENDGAESNVVRPNQSIQLADVTNAASTGMFYDWTMGMGAELVQREGVPLAPAGSVGEWLEKDASPVERKNFFDFLNLLGSFEQRLGLQQRRQGSQQDGEVVLQLGSKLRVAMRFVTK